MTEIPGADYAWSHPGGAALQKAGIRFVCRYSSTDPTKDLTRAEADDLAAHGIWSVIVRESTAKRASQGRAAGVTDAKAAVATGKACGMPSGRPLYFAVDYDADPTDVVAYFQGIASVIGLQRTGVYGGYKVVKYLLDHGYAKWAWQTAAWSGNRWDPRANIRQLIATRTIGGVSCDVNTATTADYGQWQPGKLPNLEDTDMTPEQAKQLADLHALLTPAGGWNYRNAAQAKKNPKMPDAYGYLQQTASGVQKLVADNAALTAAFAALEKKGGLTADQITAAAKAGADAALAELGDALTPKES